MTAYIRARAAERKGAQIIAEHMQNPMQEKMQDATITVLDEGGTQMQLITLCLYMSLVRTTWLRPIRTDSHLCLAIRWEMMTAEPLDLITA